jgi:hypothetical protein
VGSKFVICVVVGPTQSCVAGSMTGSVHTGAAKVPCNSAFVGTSALVNVL